MTDAVIGFVTFANQSQTTVTGGGSDAPSSGTSEQWTVSSSASFPNASVATVPPQSFAVADTAATSEIIQVTAVTGAVWGVTRGAESTTPVTHASDFTVQQVVTAGALQNFVQQPNSGATAASTVAASTTGGTLASYTPQTIDAPGQGVVYDFTLFGTMWNLAAATLFTISTMWGATTLASAVTGLQGTFPSTMTAESFWIEGKVDCYGATTMVSGFNMEANKLGTLGSLIGASSGPLTTSGSTGPLSVIVNTGAGCSIHTTGFLFHRIA